MLKNNILLVLIVGVLMSCQQNKSQIVKDVSVVEFAKKINNKDSFLLDVRTPAEVQDGVIEGAVVLDFMDGSFRQKYKSLIPKDKTLYIYCRWGNRSRRAAVFLYENGYTEINHLDGGIKAWNQAGKKTVSRDD